MGVLLTLLYDMLSLLYYYDYGQAEQGNWISICETHVIIFNRNVPFVMIKNPPPQHDHGLPSSPWLFIVRLAKHSFVISISISRFTLFVIVMLLHEMHLNCFIRELFPALMRTFGHETSLITLTMMIMKMLIMKLLQLLLTTWGQSLFASHSSQSE